MPIKDWSICEKRAEIKSILKKEVIEEGSNVTNKIERILYEFCICDVCLGEVRIKDFGKMYPKNGAIIYQRTPGGRKYPVAFHNKCFKKGIEDINEFYRKK